ncbi:MAG: hypothetical protein H6672_07570 [Anaerolineaceae bacterium]|nr:hypothetical protein [Anaerolineaceae bacterium]
MQIVPRYKILLRYDIRLGMQEPYYQFIMNEFLPGMQNMGIYPIAAYHTAYGDYPVRQLDFVTENLDTVREVFESERWVTLEDRLKSFIIHYDRKIVRYRDSFQF